MRARPRYVNVRPYLPHALVATAAVTGIPLLAVIALLRVTHPPFVVVVLFAALVSLLVAGAGALMWRARPESADIAFGELLIWGWLARKRADDRLDRGAALLGLDRSGHPTQPVRISPDHQLRVLQDLNSALEAKDPYTHGHSQRVERHVYRTAAAMGLSVDEIEELRLAAALHDVGKIRVPDRVLRKPGRLTKDERVLVEDHVVVGAWMVSSVGSADVIATVRHHHERWDGYGYPDGLAGADIPLFARIVAVADAYDAITSTRPYRVSAGREHAVGVLRAESGSQFDPMIVDAFVDALPVRLPVAGALILLSGPVALGRRIALWLKRVGAGHLAPAAATLGAVLTLGSFIPDAGPRLTPPPPAIAADATTSSTEATGGAVVINRRTHRDEPAREPAATDVVFGARIERPADAAGTGSSSASEADAARRERQPAPALRPEPQPRPQPQPRPEPQPAPADRPDQSDQSDPRDCAEGPQGQGRESSEHGRTTAHERSDGRGPNHC